MLRLARTLALVATLAAPTLVGCNSVLGIDEAHEREDGTASSKALEVPTDTCNGPQPAACGACIGTSCAGSLENCLKSHDCRVALNQYRRCLGAKCDDSSCLVALKAGPASELAGCALNAAECPQCPGATPLADICDLYCACMQQPMPASAGEPYVGKTCEQYNDTNLKDWTAGDRESCRVACRGLKDPAAAHCRWTHCELAQSTELALHCGHAIGESRCPLAADLDAECKDRRINGWGCDRSDQCCSDSCAAHVCGP